MSTLMQALQAELGGQSLGQIAGALGTDQQTTQSAIAAALPALIGGLAKNANASPEGAQALDRALERDHSQPFEGLGGLSGLAGALGFLGGGAAQGQGQGQAQDGMGALMGMAASMLSGGAPAPKPQNKGLDGFGILRHVLGSQQQDVAKGVSQASGLDQGSAAKLLPMLAPLVMSALGTVRQEKGLDSGGVANLLAEERQQMTQQAPAAQGIMALLDRDGDGSAMDDLGGLAQQLAGSGLLKGLF